MAKDKGILLDPATDDLQIDATRDAQGVVVRGLAVGETAVQNQGLILRAFKGEYKEYPTLGAGISDILGDHEIVGWRREIALQLQADGMKVREVELDMANNKLTIDAAYGS
ncbi:hypothetical protein [uncultured Alistipes sp.]|uniref:hypothetical protein n=1 Tax=uncultured Alistipes sp. TaxID=538949 RepID=UPI00272BEE8F|nr:hypothetical protein [uncultured Alistipes sp.]